jgi:hypothetical protein
MDHHDALEQSSGMLQLLCALHQGVFALVLQHICLKQP